MTGQHLSFPSVPAAPWAKSLLGCSGCSCHNNKMMQQFPLLGMQEQRQCWGLGWVSAGAGKSPSGTKPSVVVIVPSAVLETAPCEPGLGAFLPRDTWLPRLQLPSPKDGSSVPQEPEPHIHRGMRREKPGGLSPCCCTGHS